MTNPERFQPLHEHALALLERLETRFAVHRSEGFELQRGLMQAFDYARPPVTLTPISAEAAPIAIAFTTFPSLVVRCGRWYAQPFPSCGCDACAETAAGETERLDSLVRRVVAGQFAESLRLPWFGAARLVYVLSGGQSGEGTDEGWTTIPRAVGRALAGPKPHRVQWHPWPHWAGRADASAPAV